MQLERREWLKAAGSAVVAAAGSAALSGCTKEAESATTVRYAMVIDLRRCIGCRACAVACKAENGVILGGFRSWVTYEEGGRYPNAKRYFMPRLCNHCERPLCLKVCPPGATYKRPDGIVEIDKNRCIGCRHCMAACPYQARYFVAGRDPQGQARFPARTWGTVDKCTFCSHRVDNGLVPACVNTCPASARIFGDLNDPDSEVAQLVANEPVSTLRPELGTRPSVFYIGAHLPGTETEP